MPFNEDHGANINIEAKNARTTCYTMLHISERQKYNVKTKLKYLENR